MRVCFFNRSYWPDYGATGQLLTELAEHLTGDHKVDVTVVAGRPLHGDHPTGGWTPVSREARNGVTILRAAGTTRAPRSLPGRVANYVTYFVSACVAGLMVRRPDLVVSLTDPPIIGLAAWMTARRTGARFVFLCQDIFPEVTVLVEGFRSGVINGLLDRVNRFVLRKADHVIALGETMRERLVAKGAEPARTTVIHNWADCSAIVPGPKRNAFSSEHGLADAFVVMHSGNVGLSQNLDTLLDDAARLRDRPGIVFVIVGEGAKKAALQARVRAESLPNVSFLPYQPRERLAELFATADVFVVSLRAGLAGCIVPSKLYGILAAGRPCVAAVEERCEVAMITRRFESGLVAEPGNADDLAEKILAFHSDPALRRRMGENARRAALEFDRPRQVRAYYDTFRGVVAASLGATSPAKRAFDCGLAGLGLFLSAPLWLLFAAAIRLQDGGPVFYGQERVGRGGARFRSWKFRTMVPDSDARFGPLQARDADARVTRIGRLLRATAMDELPQLWNVFRGDMSFVGPRALMPEEIEVNGAGEAVPIEKIPGYEERHRVVPGLTGLAQIYADRDIPRRQKFRYDILYIRRRTFWLDLRLILLSFWITVRGAWERRGRKF